MSVPKNKAEALRLHRQAAEKGDKGAMVSLAKLLREDQPTASDEAEALRWSETAARAYRTAADGDSLSARLAMAHLVQDGMGQPPDSEAKQLADSSLRRLQELAAKNDVAAMILLGGIYWVDGPLKNQAETVRWMRPAAEAGNAFAMGRLAISAHYGWGMPQDAAEELRWLHKAADTGDATSMRNLGDAILNAKPTSEDRAEGERWLEMAVAKGDVNAMWYLGLRAAEPRRSAEWYLRAAQAGHEYAMISYAESLLAGRGVAKDEAAAKRWLEHAARLGNTDATKKLESMSTREPKQPVEPAPQAGAAKESQPAPLSLDQERALKPGMTFKECAECPEMLVIPAGTFLLGSPNSESLRAEDEGPQTKITFARPLAVSKFEVTVEQFTAFMDHTEQFIEEKCYTVEQGTFEYKARRSFRNPGFAQTGTHPATCVEWSDAKAYVAWLSQRTGKPYRLLSEAEWEYAARGGRSAAYNFGEESDAICQYANGADLSGKEAVPSMLITECRDEHAFTAPVGSFPPNIFGLYDMLGNVMEWVEDCYHDSYKGLAVDGAPQTTPRDGICLHITRGGSWTGYYGSLRVAKRTTNTTRTWDYGVRVARSLGAE
jgi:formylglycine-generating enzyme required for sulfatase activity